jgi:hypothetical protein
MEVPRVRLVTFITSICSLQRVRNALLVFAQHVSESSLYISLDKFRCYLRCLIRGFRLKCLIVLAILEGVRISVF